MNRNAELGAAVVGGYILGRTKKGRAALRMAMWLSGDQGQQVIQVTRNGITTLIASQAGQQLIGSVREQAQNRAQALTSNLEERTSNLGTDLPKALDGIGKAGAKAGKRISGRKEEPEEQDEANDEQPEQEAPAKSRRPAKAKAEPEPEDDDQDAPSPELDKAEDDDDYTEEELKKMGIRQLRSIAKEYYEPDSLKNTTKEDLVGYILQAQDDEDYEDDDEQQEKAS